jgi:hypothetical protein
MAIYNESKHGKIIQEGTGFTMCVLPNNHNNRSESYLTKNIKEFYKGKGYYEEVAIWEQGFINKMCVIDLYNPLLSQGIEIHNKNNSNLKKFIAKLRVYESYFYDVKVIMLENKLLVQKRLIDNGFETIIIPKGDRLTLLFPMENKI